MLPSSPHQPLTPTSLLLFLLLSVFVTTPASAVDGLPNNLTLDIGPDHPIPGTHSFSLVSLPSVSSVVSVNVPSDIPSTVFHSAVEGSSFSLSLALAPGTYNLDLGFLETRFCPSSPYYYYYTPSSSSSSASPLSSRRVFHVYVNDALLLESFDISQAAASTACNLAYVETIPSVTVSFIEILPLTIRLEAVSGGPATLSYLRILPAKTQCVPVTDRDSSTVEDLHLAHAIPGNYAPRVDTDGDMHEVFRLDGRESHTHFSYSGGSGKIVRYEWTLVETGEIISTEATFRYKFPLGTTRVRLTVVDDACTQDRDETSITVTTSVLPGQYCYFYPFIDVDDGSDPTTSSSTVNLQPQTLSTASVRPIASAVSLSSNVNFPSDVDLVASNSRFVMRCTFIVQFAESSMAALSVDTADSGSARVYKGSDLALDSLNSSSASDAKYPQGMQSFEVIYVRTNVAVPPVLDLRIAGMRQTSTLFHDQAFVLPIVSAIDPSSGSLAGGGTVRVTGYGLYAPTTVWFGDAAVNVKRNAGGGSPNDAFVTAPAMEIPGKVELVVESATGVRSNAVVYEYESKCDDVSFDIAKLTENGGEKVKLNQPTSAVLGHDNRLYVGTRSGRIEVFSYDAITLEVTDRCHSEQFRDGSYTNNNGALARREILGITVDPRDNRPRPYVSVNTLYWGAKGFIDSGNLKAWANGAIERFKPVTDASELEKTPQQCLKHDRNIVRNLPVSDADHGVNELLFTQDGDLLIAVGGNTNMGLPGSKFGGLWESYFSASVVIARLSRGQDFDGDIPYTTPDRVDTARPAPDYVDVELYATGTRNMFALSMARDGRILGVDMGPNNLYGNASTTCTQYNTSDLNNAENNRIDAVPGLFAIDPFRPGERKYGPTRGDKLLEIKEGKFYGHPNLQRALLTDNAGECAWVDPKTGKQPGGGEPPVNYEHRLSYFSSAETGIQEYASAHFCAKLRDDLIMSKNSGQGSLRVRMDKSGNGKVSSVPHKFVEKSGIRVVENVRGDLLFPQYVGNGGVLVYRPRVKSTVGLSLTNVLPFRHGRNGGTPLTVGGSGFKEGVIVSVGGEICPAVRVSETEIVCTVPAGTGGSLVAVGVVVEDQEVTLDRAVLYMKV